MEEQPLISFGSQQQQGEQTADEEQKQLQPQETLTQQPPLDPLPQSQPVSEEPEQQEGEEGKEGQNRERERAPQISLPDTMESEGVDIPIETPNAQVKSTPLQEGRNQTSATGEGSSLKANQQNNMAPPIEGAGLPSTMPEDLVKSLVQGVQEPPRQTPEQYRMTKHVKEPGRRSVPFLTPEEFKKLAERAMSADQETLPFPLSVEAVKFPEGSEPIVAIRFHLGTPENPDNAVVHRPVSLFTQLSSALRVHCGHDSAIPCSPNLERFMKAKHEKLQKRLIEEFERYLRFVSGHRALRRSLPFKEFCCLQASKVSTRLTELEDEKFATKFEEPNAVAKAATLVRKTLGIIRVPFKKDLDSMKDFKEADDTIQSQLVPFLDRTVQEITDMYEATFHSSTQLKSLARTQIRAAKIIAESLGKISTSFTKAAQSQLFLRTNSSDADTVASSPLVYANVDDFDTEGPSTRIRPGDAYECKLNEFVAANVILPNTQGPLAMTGGMHSTGRALFVASEEILIDAAVPILLARELLRSLGKILDNRQVLLQRTRLARWELASFRKRMQRERTAGKATTPETERQNQEHEMEIVKELKMHQTSLVNFTNNFFYNYRYVFGSVAELLGPIPIADKTAFLALGQSISQIWSTLPVDGEMPQFGLSPLDEGPSDLASETASEMVPLG